MQNCTLWTFFKTFFLIKKKAKGKKPKSIQQKKSFFLRSRYAKQSEHTLFRFYEQNKNQKKVFDHFHSSLNERVEIKGFEPLAPALQRQCSTNWAIFPFLPNTVGFSLFFSKKKKRRKSWTILDLNQWTSRLSSERSNQLS